MSVSDTIQSGFIVEKVFVSSDRVTVPYNQNLKRFKGRVSSRVSSIRGPSELRTFAPAPRQGRRRGRCRARTSCLCTRLCSLCLRTSCAAQRAMSGSGQRRGSAAGQCPCCGAGSGECPSCGTDNHQPSMMLGAISGMLGFPAPGPLWGEEPDAAEAEPWNPAVLARVRS